MSLPVFQTTIVNEFGEIIPSPVMTILDESTGQPASLFSDRNGTVPLGTNGVFTGGTNGFAQFFTAAGNYRVKAEQASAGFEQTWDFVAMVGDSAFYQVGIGASQIPTNALLPNFGTAAEADVQTSPTDATPDRAMLNGAFGLGGVGVAIPSNDYNLALTPATYSGAGNSGTNAPTTNARFGPLVVNWSDTSGDRITQEASNGSGASNTYDKECRASTDGGLTWSAWQPVYTGANYQPTSFFGLNVKTTLFNNSGGSLANNATTSGSNLRVGKYISGVFTIVAVAYAGTWQNVSGTTIENGQAGQFVRTI